MYSFTVLEARSFKSGCLQRYALFEVSRGESFFVSCCFWSLLATLAISWLVDVSHPCPSPTSRACSNSCPLSW
uniref:Uncharacterized protein n=1 Tax=Bos mutus grunniens TaxID=30521 RepID=A0A8C0A2C6_BOSMU